MPAAIERHYLDSRDAATEWARKRFEVDMPADHRAFIGPNKERHGGGWMSDEDATSTGPIVWLKTRLCELGLLPPGMPDESDDLPFMFIGKHKKYLQIAPVARSKMFRTALAVYPIDLTSGRVAGIGVAFKKSKPIYRDNS